MTFYDNEKKYNEIPLDASVAGINIRKEMKEEIVKWDTGFINSLIIITTPIQSWTDIQQLVDSNTKNLQLKLLKYAATDNENNNVECDNLQYSWYITAFSYQLATDTLYGGQYFFTDDEKLYIVSLSSDDVHDINAFVKSVKTIQCDN